MTAPLNLEEGQSIYHPPKFDGTCYWWWKVRMHDFIMVEDCEFWDIICDGPFVPIKTSGEYTKADKKALKKNPRAKKILVYGLEPNEYDRISTCDTTKEIWEALQIAYDGTTQVKQNKSNTDDSSTMAVEGKETGYDSTLALMGQSDNDEDNGNEEVNFRDVQKNLKSYSPKKLMCLVDILITAFCSLAEDRDSLFLELEESEHTRKDLVAVITDQKNAIETLRKEKSDLLAEAADQREQIVEPLTKSKPENPERGKEIVSEEYIRLEDEVKALRCRMSAEIEKNELLQANLEKVMNDLEKSLKWTWSIEVTTTLFTNDTEKGRGAGFSRKKDPYNPHSKSTTTSDNWPRTQCENTGYSKEGVQAKNQSVLKDKVVAETVITKEGPSSTHRKCILPAWTKRGTVKGSGQQRFMDSGCSKHMTGNTTNFLSLKSLQGGSVSFGNGKKGCILGVGKVGKSLTHSIENVYYVNRLKYSLLSVSQICDKGNKVEFLSKICTVADLVTGEIVLVAKRYKNIYVYDFESLQSGDLSCLKAVNDDAELWHRRLGHASFSLLNKLIQKDLAYVTILNSKSLRCLC
ncbi:uncharacterized protein [Nicotiana sylvestris]|uniref:uncharacterized protein n=1 Tax=Nicotiana sylvestris TaxID=4096 RepID=UPI00388C65E8